MITRSKESLGTWRACREFRELLFREIIPAIEEARGKELAAQLKGGSGTTITEGYGRYDYEKHPAFCTETRESLLHCVKLLAQAHVENLLGDELYSRALAAANEALVLLDSYADHFARPNAVRLATNA